MKTTEINSIATTRFFLKFTATLAALLFIASIILHSKPLLLINDIADFTTHHYFLTGFIALVVFFICLKFYYTSTESGRKKYAVKKAYRVNRLIKRKERLNFYSKKFSLKIQTLKSHFIDKNKVSDLQFNQNDVLNNVEDIDRRNEDLQRAMLLGNSYKHKVKLFFKDKFMNKHIETTVWHANYNHVTLKGGVVLPVKSIYKVEI